VDEDVVGNRFALNPHLCSSGQLFVREM